MSHEHLDMEDDFNPVYQVKSQYSAYKKWTNKMNEQLRDSFDNSDSLDYSSTQADEVLKLVFDDSWILSHE